MKKLLFTFLILFTISNHIVAQQDAQYTQYIFNNLIINPAYAGTREAISTAVFYRHQWTGIDKAPRTFSVNGHSPLRENMGIGGYIENDRIGVHNRFSLFVDYAYRLPLTQTGTLSLGLQAGFLHYSSKWSQLDGIRDANDPNLAEDGGKLLPNFGLGLYYYTDRYYGGVSIPHLLDSSLDNVTEVASQFRHYFVTAGVVFDVTPTLKIKPSTLIKLVKSAPPQIDLNVNFLLQDALWLGVGYRTGDALMVMAQYQFDKGVRVGYAYDFTLSKLNKFNSGTHELMVGFDFLPQKGKGSNKVLSPRFF